MLDLRAEEGTMQTDLTIDEERAALERAIGHQLVLIRDARLCQLPVRTLRAMLADLDVQDVISEVSNLTEIIETS
jgi:hypothetical protein